MTERDRLEANAAVILAGILATPHPPPKNPERVAVCMAEHIRDEVRERHPHAWEKEEAR